MSFDIYIQRFEDGEPLPIGRPTVLTAIKECSIANPVPDDNGFLHFETHDGCADVYGIKADSMSLLFNHVSGTKAWDAIWSIADAAGAVIFPIGAPTMATSPELLEQLPDGLDEQAVIVASPAAALRVVEASRRQLWVTLAAQFIRRSESGIASEAPSHSDPGTSPQRSDPGMERSR